MRAYNMVSDDVPRLNPSDFLKLFTAAFSVFGILHFLGFPEHVGSKRAWAWNVSSPSSSTTSATSMERRRAIVMMSFHSSEPQNVDFVSFKHFRIQALGIRMGDASAVCDSHKSSLVNATVCHPLPPFRR